jgi:hypothetical protein
MVSFYGRVVASNGEPRYFFLYPGFPCGDCFVIVIVISELGSVLFNLIMLCVLFVCLSYASCARSMLSVSLLPILDCPLVLSNV